VLGGDDLFLRGISLPVYGSTGVAGTAFICPNPSTLRVAGSSLHLVYRDCPPPVIPLLGGAFHVSSEAQLQYAIGQGSWIVLDADVTLTSPLPMVRSRLRVTGGRCTAPGNATCRYAISGGNAFRIFRVQHSELWLENLVLINGWGQPTIGQVADSDGSGGAVSLIDSIGTFVNVVFSNHNATGNGGAVFATRGSVNFTTCRLTANKAGASGGAVYVDSVLTIVNTTVINNDAGGDGGAVAQAVGSTGHYSGCLFDSNVAGLTAGAVYTGPKATSRFDLCAFSNNIAEDGLDMFIKVSSRWIALASFLWLQ
jgi:predicted outer membrane repeat protein